MGQRRELKEQNSEGGRSRRESTKGCFNPGKNSSSPRGKNKAEEEAKGLGEL